MDKEIKILVVVVMLITCSSIVYITHVSNETLQWKQQRLNEMWDNWVFPEPVDIKINQTWNALCNQTIPEKSGG